MRKGSVTIFLCLVMTVMAALLLGCIFSVKVRAGRAMLVNGSDQALFSLLARYDRQMLEDFDVFLLDGGCGTSELHPEKLSRWALDDLSYIANPARGLWPLSSKSLLDLSVEACDLTGYTLITDAGGRIFRDAALRYQKETGLITSAAAAVNWIRSLKNLSDAQEQAYAVVAAASASGDLDEARKAARQVSGRLAEAAAAAANAQTAAGGAGIETMSALRRTGSFREDRTGYFEKLTGGFAAGVRNLVFEKEGNAYAEEMAAGAPNVPAGLSDTMPFLSMIVASPILTLTITDASSLSWRSAKAGELYGNRPHRQGMGILEIPRSGDDPMDKFLYNEYLLSHLGNRKDVQEDAALYCPAEYLIVGSTEDARNVEGVINRILLFREGVNLVFLLNDPVKSAMLKTAGLTIATVAGQPEIANELATALAAAWAYAESLVDIRGLFLGKRNCFLKDSAHWQLGLGDFPAFFGGGIDHLVKGSGAGPGYLDYLRMLLFLENADTVLRRSLDMVELCERGKDRPDFRLDNGLTNVTIFAEALSERRIRMSCERSCGYREL